VPPIFAPYVDVTILHIFTASGKNLPQTSEGTNLDLTGCGVLVTSVADGQCQRGVARAVPHGTGVVPTVLDMANEPRVVHLCLAVYLAGQDIDL
jgi:hypothetical protein